MDQSACKAQFEHLRARCQQLEVDNNNLTATLAHLRAQNHEYRHTIERLEEHISLLQSSLQRGSLQSLCGLSLPVQQSIVKKALFKKVQSPLHQPKRSRDHRMFENFFVLGLKDGTDSGVFYQYPDTCEFNSAVLADFAFPGGCRAESWSEDSVHSLISSENQRGPNTFVFTIKSNKVVPKADFDIANSDREVLYCCCVTTQDVHQSQLVPLCHCLVSYHPCFELHFEVLFRLLALRKLNQLNEPSATSSDTDVSVHDTEGEEMGLLEEYFENFSIAESHCSINLQTVPSIDFPLTDLAVIDCEWTCPVLFALLTCDDFVKLLCAVMHEKSIVFVSTNLDYISSCVLAITSLMRPFKWQHLICPLLPEALKDVMDAPVPLLTGATFYPPKSLISSHFVVVDLDNPVIAKRVSPFTQAEMRSLKSTVASLYHLFSEASIYELTDTKKSAVASIAKETRKLWSSLLSAAASDITLAEIPKEDRQFAEEMLETQYFSKALEDSSP